MHEVHDRGLRGHHMRDREGSMRYNGPMKFRTGLLIGAAFGYYYGTKAGPERHAQLERILDRVRATGTYRAISDRMYELQDLGRERVMGLVDSIVAQSESEQTARHTVIGDDQGVSPRDDTEPFYLLTNGQQN